MTVHGGSIRLNLAWRSRPQRLVRAATRCSGFIWWENLILPTLGINLISKACFHGSHRITKFHFNLFTSQEAICDYWYWREGTYFIRKYFSHAALYTYPFLSRTETSPYRSNIFHKNNNVEQKCLRFSLIYSLCYTLIAVGPKKSETWSRRHRFLKTETHVIQWHPTTILLEWYFMPYSFYKRILQADIITKTNTPVITSKKKEEAYISDWHVYSQ